MKSLNYLLTASLFILILFSCNNRGEKVEAADTTTTTTIETLQQGATDVIKIKKQLNDSINKAIDSVNIVIVNLQNASDTAIGQVRNQIVAQRGTLINVNDNIRSIRIGLTSQALRTLIDQLKPSIDLLRSQLIKLQKLGDTIESVVNVLGFVDVILTSAISAGILKAPVSLSDLPVTQLPN